jgi:hypothetical protein
MPGLSDFEAEAFLNHATGCIPLTGAAASRYLALFTTPPTSDAGTGGTEVSGGSYARPQVAGAVAATASFTTSSPNITMTSNPGWVVPGMNVYDLTNGQQIGTVLTYSGTSLVLTGNAAHASSGSADSLQFSAWPQASASSGNEPATTPANVANGAAITFVQSSASWGTAEAWGLYDALSGVDLLFWDYFGNYKWSPFTCTSATPGVLTCTDQTFVNGEYAVVTAKFGGTLPTTGGSWAGILSVAGVSGATFNLGVNTTGAGDGLVRQVLEYSIGISTTISFAASSFTLQLA